MNIALMHTRLYQDSCYLCGEATKRYWLIKSETKYPPIYSSRLILCNSCKDGLLNDYLKLVSNVRAYADKESMEIVDKYFTIPDIMKIEMQANVPDMNIRPPEFYNHSEGVNPDIYGDAAVKEDEAEKAIAIALEPYRKFDESIERMNSAVREELSDNLYLIMFVVVVLMGVFVISVVREW